MATGWTQVDGQWYFLRSSGAMATGWLRDGDAWYYLTSSGAMATGSRWIDGTRYAFDGEGRLDAVGVCLARLAWLLLPARRLRLIARCRD